MVDSLTRTALDLAADLLEPVLPSQAQATTLARLDAAGFRVACLRLGDGALHWACDEAHLSPRVLSHLRQSHRDVAGGFLSLPIDRALPFTSALISLAGGFYDPPAAREHEAMQIGSETGHALLREALGVNAPCVYAPVAHRGQVRGLLLIWGDAVTQDLVEPAELLGRILGAAIARAPNNGALVGASSSCQEALHILQAVIGTLSLDQPLERSLAQIRDTLPRLMPDWLPPLFAVRDFESGRWIWRPFMPDEVARTLERHTGVSLDAIAAPVGESRAWGILSQGQAVFTQDFAELAGHLIEPELARAMQRALDIGCVATIPLYRDGEVLGLMFAWSRSDNWSYEEESLLQACAANIALALHNMRLHQRAQRLLGRMRTMLERADRLLLPAAGPQRLQAIVDEAVELLDADAGALYVLQPDGRVAAPAHRGISERYIQMVRDNFPNLRISRVMAGRAHAHIPDMTNDPNITGPVLQAVVEEGLRSMIALPLVTGGPLRAVLALYRRRAVPFSEETILGAHTFAVLSAIGYESLIQAERAERQMAQIGALMRVLKEIALLELPDSSLYDLVLEHACRLTDAQHAKLYLWDTEQHALVERASIVNGQRLDQGFVLKPGDGLAGNVFLRGAPIVLDDYMTWDGRLQRVSNDAVGPAMGVPVRLGENIIGAMVLGRTFPARFFDDEDVDIAAALADEVGIYLARVRAEEERDRQAEFAQRILDAMRCIVVVADSHTTVTTHVNRYLLDKTGWSREEIIGKPWVDTFVPPAWRDRVRDVARRLRDRAGGYRFANPILTKDGRELLVEWYNSIVRDEHGKPLQIIATGIVADS